jgi:hypothetical protein
MKKAIFLSFFAVALLISAQTASAQSSVAGNWDAVMNTPGGTVPLKLVFVVDGEKLTGTAKRSRGDVALVGTVKGSDISFSYTIDYNGNPFTVSFSGKVDGDRINGVVLMGSTEDAWSATRAKAENPKFE